MYQSFYLEWRINHLNSYPHATKTLSESNMTHLLERLSSRFAFYSQKWQNMILHSSMLKTHAKSTTISSTICSSNYIAISIEFCWWINLLKRLRIQNYNSKKTQIWLTIFVFWIIWWVSLRISNWHLWLSKRLAFFKNWVKFRGDMGDCLQI